MSPLSPWSSLRRRRLWLPRLAAHTAVLVLVGLPLASCSEDSASPWDGGAAGGGAVDAGVDGSVPVTDCDCPSTSSEEPCLGTTVSYVLQGDESLPPSAITFQFECDGGPCACGRFGNEHDYWVAPVSVGGQVRIVSMSPETVGALRALGYVED